MNYEQAIKILEYEQTKLCSQIFQPSRQCGKTYISYMNSIKILSYNVGKDWLRKNKPLSNSLESVRIIMDEYIKNKIKEFKEGYNNDN